MTHLIDKSALVAEIRKRRNKHFNSGGSPSSEYCHEDDEILGIINTLEVKEINNIWHEASETPKGAGDKEILVQFADSHASVLEIDDWEYLDHQTKWAYLKDLI